jgi:hypothetical protein
MYELFTLHRRVHKHLAMTEDGFYVLAPNNGYDSEFFERPFLALEQIAGIVRPVME